MVLIFELCKVHLRGMEEKEMRATMEASFRAMLLVFQSIQIEKATEISPHTIELRSKKKKKRRIIRMAFRSFAQRIFER